MTIGVPLDPSGNPTGFDESGMWADVDNSRPSGLRWLAVSLLTGEVLCSLPGIVSKDPVRRTLGQYESMSPKLLVTDSTSPAWLTATRPGAAALIAVRGEPGAEVIVWGGIVLRRQRPIGGNVATLTVATAECYTDRRYTGAYSTDPLGTGVTRDQNLVVSDLIAQFVVANQGLPASVVVLSNGQPVPQILAEYNDFDDKTVYSTLGALSSLINGPEWTADWAWDRAANTIKPVFYVGNRIGVVTPDGLNPQAIFTAASIVSGRLDENYSGKSGGNDITATSSGQGLARPQAISPNPPATSLDGRPRWQFRFQPATSIRDPLTLQAHADRAYDLIADGTNTVTLTSAAGAGPQLGRDWNLGDDIGYQLIGPLFPEIDPNSVAVGRAIGYEADDTTTDPVLYVPQVS